MRIILIFILSLLSFNVFSQDKNLLQKQLLQLLLDYPNKFKNLEDKNQPFVLKFQISGTEGNALILSDSAEVHVTAYLVTPNSDTEAKELFEKWVVIMDNMNINGAKLKSKDLVAGKTDIYNRGWYFDNTKNNIDRKYLPFSITIRILKFQGAYAAAMYVGD